jgi:hypothetical protein
VNATAIESTVQTAARPDQPGRRRGRHVQFLRSGRERGQLRVRSEVGNARYWPVVFWVGIAKDVVAIQLAKNADHDFRVAAAADYDDSESMTCVGTRPANLPSFPDTVSALILFNCTPPQQFWEGACLVRECCHSCDV